MEVYRNRAESKRVKLDMYLTYAPCGVPLGIPEEKAKDCARQLRNFARAHNFELNIKVAAPYYRNEEELCYLMTSEYCTVKAFRKNDYKKLARYLGVTNNSRQTQAMEKRDDDTRRKLKEIKYGEYDCTNI